MLLAFELKENKCMKVKKTRIEAVEEGEEDMDGRALS